MEKLSLKRDADVVSETLQPIEQSSDSSGMNKRQCLVIGIVLLVLESALAATALVFEFVPNASYVGLRSSLLAVAAVALCIHASTRMCDFQGKKWICVCVLAALFAIGWILGLVLSDLPSATALSHPKLSTVIVLLGSFILFRALVVELSGIADALAGKERPWDFSPLKACVIVTGVSVIYLVIFYPGATFNDGMRQLHAWFGDITWTNHDPAFATTLIGVCANVGRAFADGNFGMFLYNLLVVTCSSIVFWRAFVLLQEMKTPRALGIGSLAFWSLLPIVHFYLITMCKDSAFAVAMMALVVLLMRMLLHRWEDVSKSQIAGMLLLMLLLCNLRNDGVWICLFTLVVMFASIKKSRAIVSCGMALLLVFHFVYGAVLLPALGIMPGSTREALSVPVQQIALLARDHPEAFSQQDEEAVAELFSTSVEDLGAAYDPNLSDPVKNKLAYKLSGEQASELAGLWGRGLIARPGTYLLAYFSNYYGYFYPDKIGNEEGFSDFSVSDYYQYNMDYSQPNWSAPLRQCATRLVEVITRLPVISWFYCPGFYSWVLAACAAFVLSRGRVRELVPLAPLAAVLIIACLSPVNCRIRYVLSLVFCLPLIVAWTWRLNGFKHDGTGVD